MTRDIENLVFEGGGVKGIAYIGAIRVLDQEKRLPQIKRVGGASAGAITALALGLGYSLADVENILKNTDFRKFQDNSWGILRDLWRFFSKYGLNPGEVFLQWVKDLIANVTGDANCTFEQFEKLRHEAQSNNHFFFLNRRNFGTAKSAYEQMLRLKNAKAMYFIVTNLDIRESEVLSHEHPTKFDIAIADAVRASMSIPFFFTAYKIPHRTGTCTYVDGGVLNNFPIRLFDFTRFILPGHENDEIKSQNVMVNPKTLGFRVDKKDTIKMLSEGDKLPDNPIEDFRDYVSTLMTVILNAQDASHRLSEDWARTIYINSGKIETTQFDLTKEDEDWLIHSGEQATRDYFIKYIKVNITSRITALEAQLALIMAELKTIAPEHVNSIKTKFFGTGASRTFDSATNDEASVSSSRVPTSMP